MNKNVKFYGTLGVALAILFSLGGHHASSNHSQSEPPLVAYLTAGNAGPTLAGMAQADPDDVIQTGKDFCQAIGGGQTVDDTTAAFIVNTPDITQVQAAAFLGAAIGDLCPQYTSEIGG